MQKTVLITGGAQGIGQVSAEHLYNEGYYVCILDSDEVAIDEFHELHPAIKIYSGNVSEEKVVSEVIRAIKDVGQLYAVINNAAVSINKPVTALSLEEWNRVIGVNLDAAFLMAKYAFPFLKENNGCIVNIASTRALMSEANTEAYSASKGGIVALTHALAASFAPYVRVNAISPGWIETSDHKKSAIRKPVIHSEADRLQHLVGRVGRPSDIASMITYLLSEKATFITGQNFIIDGGMTKKMIYV